MSDAFTNEVAKGSINVCYDEIRKIEADIAKLGNGFFARIKRENLRDDRFKVISRLLDVRAKNPEIVRYIPPGHTRGDWEPEL